MNRTSKIILALFLSGSVVYACCVFLCKLGDKCNNCDQTSTTITESKKNNFFLTEYDIDKSIIKLKNHSEEVKVKRIWAEKTWKYPGCYKIFNRGKLEPGNSYNVIVEFSRTTDQFLFTLTPIVNGVVDNSNGGIENIRKTMRFDELPNELKLILTEKNPDPNVGWQNGIISDTLTLSLKNVR